LLVKGEVPFVPCQIDNEWFKQMLFTPVNTEKGPIDLLRDFFSNTGEKAMVECFNRLNNAGLCPCCGPMLDDAIYDNMREVQRRLFGGMVAWEEKGLYNMTLGNYFKQWKVQNSGAVEWKRKLISYLTLALFYGVEFEILCQDYNTRCRCQEWLDVQLEEEEHVRIHQTERSTSYWQHFESPLSQAKCERQDTETQIASLFLQRQKYYRQRIGMVQMSQRDVLCFCKGVVDKKVRVSPLVDNLAIQYFQESLPFPTLYTGDWDDLLEITPVKRVVISKDFSVVELARDDLSHECSVDADGDCDICLVNLGVRKVSELEGVEPQVEEGVYPYAPAKGFIRQYNGSYRQLIAVVGSYRFVALYAEGKGLGTKQFLFIPRNGKMIEGSSTAKFTPEVMKDKDMFEEIPRLFRSAATFMDPYSGGWLVTGRYEIYMTLYGTHGTMTVWDGERFMLRIPYVILTQGDTKFFICLAGELALRNYLGVYYLNGVKIDERVPYQNSFGWCVSRSLLISSVHTARYYDMDCTTWEGPDGGEGEGPPSLISSDEAIEQDVSMVSFLRQLLRAPDQSQVDTLLNDSNVNSRAEALSAIWSSQSTPENHYHVRSSGPHLMSPVSLTGEVQMESRLQEPSMRRGVVFERTGVGAWDNRYENGCSCDNCPWCERLGCHGVNCSDYTCDTCDKIEPCEFDCGRCVQCQQSV